MNRFKDEQGRIWLVTSQMAKQLGVSGSTLANYKLDGSLKRGHHWVQQTTGHRRVFYNKDVVLDWWGKTGSITSKETCSSAPTAHTTCQTLSVRIGDEAFEKLLRIQRDSTIVIEKKIDGIVLSSSEETPKLGTVVNMLIRRAINDYFEDSAA